ncbi:MAG: class I SAM-dependent methyltransferase [Nitrospirae bacterium]|nr:class I SAM-dependent methyltransferase [Nitrospirota bacterium]
MPDPSSHPAGSSRSAESTEVKGPCPVCREERKFRAVERCGEFTVAECLSCGLCFSSPMKAGDQAYYETHFSPDFYWRWEFGRLLKDLPCRGGRLAELGCHTGHFLSRARDAGYQVTGFDVNERALKFAGAHYGLSDLRTANFLEPRSMAGVRSFDVLVCFQVIEHLPDPVGFLQNLRPLVERQGCLVLSTPNAERWTLRFGRESWDFPPHHLTRWTHSAFEKALKKAGLHVEKLVIQPSHDLRAARSYLENLLLSATSVNALSSTMAPGMQGTENGPKGRSAFLRSWITPLRRAKGAMIRSAVNLGGPFMIPYLAVRNFGGENLYAIARFDGS